MILKIISEIFNVITNNLWLSISYGARHFDQHKSRLTRTFLSLTHAHAETRNEIPLIINEYNKQHEWELSIFALSRCAQARRI